MESPTEQQTLSKSKPEAMKKPAMQCKHLSFWYGDKQILHNVSMTIDVKQITALIGPSGCGKSTLLRCLNRMNDVIVLSRLRGEVLYHGDDIYEKQVDAVDLRKQIGMVFQKPNPFPMSIFDNVAYGLRVQGMKGKAALAAKVRESLEKADLWSEVKDRLDMSAFRLSGGQQQRLCIARTLAIDPDVILFDEPCSALDPISTSKIEDLLVKLKEKHTIIIVTHNMQQAKRIADDVAYLLHGELIEFGETEAVFKTPQKKLTADYINGVFG